MRTATFLCAAFLLLHTTVHAGEDPPAARMKAAEAKASRARDTLLKEFNDFLDDPDKFRKTVRKECHMFPEGDVIPYIMPAYAYANLALTGDLPKKEAAKRIAQLIELAIPGVVAEVKPPGRKLENLRDYQESAVFLGQLNLALECYRMAGGDDRFEKTRKVISKVLYEALVKSEGVQIKSYPNLVWTFDTIPVLLSLKLEDIRTGGKRSNEVIKNHMEWVQKFATDKHTKLPFSRTGRQGTRPHPPRGCDLSLRICMVYDLDKEYAKKMYSEYVTSFWLDHGIVAGFAEWPHGAAKGEDLDSGPVVLGIGMTANGFGIATTKAMNDRKRFVRLMQQLGSMQMLEKQIRLRDPRAAGSQLTAKLIPKNDKYYTGFLFGDACLFYSVTWTPLTHRNAEEKARTVQGTNR